MARNNCHALHRVSHVALDVARCVGRRLQYGVSRIALLGGFVPHVVCGVAYRVLRYVFYFAPRAVCCDANRTLTGAACGMMHLA